MERKTNPKYYVENVEEGYFGDQPISPNTIPSIAGFVGREEYLVELRESYQKGSRIFVLHGTGGVGKTALALQFAGEIADKYTAKILVEMNGMSDAPLSARSAMLEIVRHFDRDVRADVSDAELKNLFVQFTQNQPTLIVLDNAASRESVELPKPKEACFIVTSRHSFVLTGGRSKQILKMLPEDARKLLYEIADESRFDNRADELAYLAGYLPMALKPLASILAEDELETAADLIKRFADRKELLKERVSDYDNLTIEASFGLSYDKLPAEMQTRWRRLSVFPADFDEAAIAAVLEIDTDEAHETQRQLRRYSLLELNPETKRFDLHDLIRAFTNEKLKDSELLQTKKQHALFYQKLLHQIALIKEQQGFKIALSLVDSEWKNIISGYKFVDKLSSNNVTAAQLCLAYCQVIADLIVLRLTGAEFVKWLTSGLNSAYRLNNTEAISTHLCNLGVAHQNLGEYHEAIKYQERSLETSFDQEGKAINLVNLGASYKSIGKYRKAIELFESALAISREINDKEGESTCLGNLGNAHDSLGQTLKSIEYHEGALKISKEISNPILESRHLSNLGAAFFSLGEYTKSIEYSEQALIITKEMGDRRSEVIRLGNLGSVYAILEEYSRAVEYFDRAIEIAQQMGDQQGQATSLANIGSVYGKSGEPKKAIEFHTKALGLYRKIGDKHGEGQCIDNLGTSYLNLNERDKACGLWKEALAVLEAIESPDADVTRQKIKKYCQS